MKGVFSPYSMLPEVKAVVAPDTNNGILLQAEFPKRAEQSADLLINVRNRCCVGVEHRFPAEDPFIFVYRASLYAILSDHAVFTGIQQALCLFRSKNGTDWQLAEHSLISDLTVELEDGEKETLADLERPQLIFDEKGEPLILFCAATRDKRPLGNTFNIQIPLQPGLSVDGREE